MRVSSAGESQSAADRLASARLSARESSDARASRSASTLASRAGTGSPRRRWAVESAARDHRSQRRRPGDRERPIPDVDRFVSRLALFGHIRVAVRGSPERVSGADVDRDPGRLEEGGPREVPLQCFRPCITERHQKVAPERRFADLTRSERTEGQIEPDRRFLPGEHPRGPFGAGTRVLGRAQRVARLRHRVEVVVGEPVDVDGLRRFLERPRDEPVQPGSPGATDLAVQPRADDPVPELPGAGPLAFDDQATLGGLLETLRHLGLGQTSDAGDRGDVEHLPDDRRRLEQLSGPGGGRARTSRSRGTRRPDSWPDRRGRAGATVDR